MPIDCPIKFPRLTEDAMREFDYQFMSHAFAAQNELGRLCDESVYQRNVANRFEAAGISTYIECPITLKFQEFAKTLFIDLVADARVPYELKTVSQLNSEHENQLLNYMLLVNARRGKVINFRSDSVESRFVNATLEDSDRHRFTIDTKYWRGDTSLPTLFIALVNDWGTSLNRALYEQAITDCLGGKEQVIQQLPMRSANGLPMGHQQFHLIDERTAFRITTLPKGVNPSHKKHLQKLIRPSPLDRMHWINIARHELRFETVIAGDEN